MHHANAGEVRDLHVHLSDLHSCAWIPDSEKNKNMYTKQNRGYRSLHYNSMNIFTCWSIWSILDYMQLLIDARSCFARSTGNDQCLEYIEFVNIM